jgi:RecB family exonuclease
MVEAWWTGEGQHGLDVVAVEHRFDVEVGPHRVTGAIDRVDRLPDGTLRVLDYKTGKTEPTAGEVAANVQLATYHLAARRDPDLAAAGEPGRLSLLFLRTMRPYTQDIGPDHEAATEARVLEVAEHMLAEEFEPSVTATCDHCHLQRLCPLWPEGREVGVAS